VKKSARAHLKREFLRLSAIQKSSKDRNDVKINRDVFIKYLTATLGDGVAPQVMDRLFQVLDTNSNGFVSARECGCGCCVADNTYDNTFVSQFN
jgi:Ca2+-binding EF-hand superfamily protein